MLKYPDLDVFVELVGIAEREAKPSPTINPDKLLRAGAPAERAFGASGCIRLSLRTGLAVEKSTARMRATCGPRSPRTVSQVTVAPSIRTSRPAFRSTDA